MKTAQPQPTNEAFRPISKWVLDRLLRAYGRGPQNADLWRIYSDLQILKDFQTDIDKRDEAPPDLDLYNRFRVSSRLADRRLDTEAARNSVDLMSKPLETLLRRVDSGARLPAGTWRDLLNQYTALIGVFGADKGIYTSTRVLPGETGSVRFRRIQKAGPKEAAREKLRVEDPELFDRLEMKDEQTREIEDNLRNRISSDGLIAKKKVIPIGKKTRVPVLVGEDPVTQEVVVYDYELQDDGTYKEDRLTEVEFIEKFRERSREKRRKAKVNVARELTGPVLNSLREYSDSQIDAALKSQTPRFVSLTDDPDKDSAITRIYPVVDLPDEDGEVPVVVAGRFRGVPMPLLVNEGGRQLEGSHRYLDGFSNQTISRDVRTPDGELSIRLSREPYVTLDRGRLLLKLPNVRNFTYGQQKSFADLLKGKVKDPEGLVESTTVLRQEMDRLASLYASIDRRGGAREKTEGDPLREALERGIEEAERAGDTKTVKELKYRLGTFVSTISWYFEAKDFDLIRARLGSLALSGGAAKHLRQYFEELAKAERAADAKNLERYSTEALGLRLPLRNHVMRALAWLDANGNRGVCALDTGMGKTVTSIAAMQNLLMKGASRGTNGRFLFVCEGNLAGNLAKEIYKFLEPEAAADLDRRVDVITYKDLTRMKRKDPSYGDKYIAVFFDEAHEQFSHRGRSPYRAATAIKCPHKVLLTASPMVKSPLEVLTMASVANGLDLTTAANKNPGDPNYRNQLQNKWIRTYCNVVGGRVTSVTDDPEAAKAFRTWVKRNLFFAPKIDTALSGGQVLEGPKEQEAQIQNLRKEVIGVTIPEDVIGEYRKQMRLAQRNLRELLKEYKKQPQAAFEAARNWNGERGAPLRMLSILAETPELVIPGAGYPKVDVAEKIINDLPMDQRTLLWTDNDKLARVSFERLREQFFGKGHVLGLSRSIIYTDPDNKTHIYTEKNFAETVAKKDDRGRPIVMRDPEDGKKKLVDPSGAFLEPKGWQTYILTKYLGLGKKRTDKEVHTATLTKKYATGQNLQSFTTVIHLDRDGWSNETMKQRTARAWRAGNERKVQEITLDMQYPITEGDADETLDEMRKVMQELDDKLFNEVILEAQVERLGEEWYSMKRERSQLYEVDKEMMLRATHPYAKEMGSKEKEV